MYQQNVGTLSEIKSEVTSDYTKKKRQVSFNLPPKPESHVVNMSHYQGQKSQISKPAIPNQKKKLRKQYDDLKDTAKQVSARPIFSPEEIQRVTSNERAELKRMSEATV